MQMQRMGMVHSEHIQRVQMTLISLRAISCQDATTVLHKSFPKFDDKGEHLEEYILLSLNV